MGYFLICSYGPLIGVRESIAVGRSPQSAPCSGAGEAKPLNRLYQSSMIAFLSPRNFLSHSRVRSVHLGLVITAASRGQNKQVIQTF